MAARKTVQLDYLRTLLEVYRAGSFSAAARNLGISQPTVTNHIQNLERHFGTPLFERGVDGVTPTLAAHEFVEAIAHHLDKVDLMVHGGRSGAAPFHPISLAGPREFITLAVIPALAGDVGALPRFTVSFGESRPLLTELETGKLDMVISTVRPRHPEIRAIPIADEEFWLVAAPSLPVPDLTPSTLDATPLVAYSADLAIIRRFWHSVFGGEPRFDPVMVIADLQAVRAAVLAGIGMSVLPSYLVAADVASGALVRLDDLDVPPINTVFLAVRKPTLESRPHIAKAAELLVARIKEYSATLDVPVAPAPRAAVSAGS